MRVKREFGVAKARAWRWAALCDPTADEMRVGRADAEDVQMMRSRTIQWLLNIPDRASYHNLGTTPIPPLLSSCSVPRRPEQRYEEVSWIPLRNRILFQVHPQATLYLNGSGWGVRLGIHSSKYSLWSLRMPIVAINKPRILSDPSFFFLATPRPWFRFLWSPILDFWCYKREKERLERC